MNLNLVAKKTVDPPLLKSIPPYLGIPPYPTAKFGSHPFLAFSEHSIPPYKRGGGGSHYDKLVRSSDKTAEKIFLVKILHIDGCSYV